MALALDPATLVAPLSSADPCGPDLDEEGDLEFLNQVAHAEALLPSSFFSRDDEGRAQPFDRSSIDFGRETSALLALLDRTRDLRALTLLARLAILDRDVAGFSDVLTAIAGLLEAQWDAVHPRGEGGGYELRGAILQSLDDMATVILPLQHVPLAHSRRHGPVSFRNVMAANGEVQPREGEAVLDQGAIARVIEEAEPAALQAHRDALSRIAEALARIRSITVERGGYGSAVGLDRLDVLIGRMRGLLNGATASAPAGKVAVAEDGQDLGGASPAAAPPVAAPAGIASSAQASAALAAAAAYLRTHEPSSPAEVLVRQALLLVGKPFVEVMRILMPSRAQDAILAIGSGRGLRLTFDQLAAVSEDHSGQAADVAPSAQDGDAPPEASVYRAGSRAEALALLSEAGVYFRVREPSSPIPLLLDKAVGLADRDFTAILRDVLPDLGSD